MRPQFLFLHKSVIVVFQFKKGGVKQSVAPVFREMGFFSGSSPFDQDVGKFEKLASKVVVFKMS